MNAKQWLRDAGHDDIADTIEKLERRWARAGKKTRRDWWAVLAGTPSLEGAPVTVGGIEFPVIAECRERQGYAPVRHAIRSKRSAPDAPAARTGGRWAE